MKKIISFLKNRTFLKYLLYSLYIFITFVLLLIFMGQPYIRDFFRSVEDATFDVRQNIVAKHMHADKNIVIISVDEASYEYLLGKYGEWPISRRIYADLIDYVEHQKPSVLAFDLMFVKSIKSSTNDDDILARNMAKYDNVFTAMNFDNQLAELRTPADLPDRLKAKVENKGNVELNNPMLTFSNCRTIINQILDKNPHIGHINLIRANDGIAREIPPFVTYKGDYYPHLALKVAMKHLERTEHLKMDKFVIDRYGNLLVGSHKIPVTKGGSAILNWYGPSGLYNKKSFDYIPFWKLEKTMYEGEKLIPADFFKDKIVYVGTSAASLADIKSVPTDRLMPGVELHTTFINNLLDNTFIKRAGFKADILVSLLLSLFVGYVVIRTKSTVLSSVISVLAVIFYTIAAGLIMQYYNIWVSITIPVSCAVLVFIAVYIAKYIMKSRDFDYTYALATTDGLTELYNHRYFQEQMVKNIETAKRYNSEFSLIILDIDFFKKFNDNYGHQAGDAVLKQVAQVLKKNVRSSDVVCRYGGEEMSIILTNTNNKDALITAQKICDAVAQKSFKLGGDIEKNVTISLGVSTYPQNGSTPSELIKYADEGLYKAKENGRNQVGIL